MSDRVSARKDGSSLTAAAILSSINRSMVFMFSLCVSEVDKVIICLNDNFRQRKFVDRGLISKEKRSSAIFAKRLRVDSCIMYVIENKVM